MFLLDYLTLYYLGGVFMYSESKSFIIYPLSDYCPEQSDAQCPKLLFLVYIFLI